MSIQLAGVLGKDPIFTIDNKEINRGNDNAWLWGIASLYPIWHTLLTYLVFKPDMLLISGYIPSYLLLFLVSVWLMAFYLFQWNIFKYIEVPIMLLVVIIVPFIEFPDGFSILGLEASKIGGGLSFAIVLLIVLLFRVLKIVLWLIPSIREPLFAYKRVYENNDVHDCFRKYFGKKAVVIQWLLWLVLGWLIIGNALVF